MPAGWCWLVLGPGPMHCRRPAPRAVLLRSSDSTMDCVRESGQLSRRLRRGNGGQSARGAGAARVCSGTVWGAAGPLAQGRARQERRTRGSKSSRTEGIDGARVTLASEPRRDILTCLKKNKTNTEKKRWGEKVVAAAVERAVPQLQQLPPRPPRRV